MSDLTAQLGFTIDASGAITGANSARDAFSGMVVAAEAAFYGLSQAAAVLQQVGGALTDFGTNIINTAATVQAAQTQVTTQIYNFNETAAQNAATTQQMGNAAIDLAVKLAQPVGSIQSLEAQIASFGDHSPADIQKITATVQELATDTNSSADQIAGPFNRTAILFNQNAAQADGLANAIRALSTNITGGADAFLLQIDRTAGLGQSLGLTTDQALAFAAEIADVDGRIRGAGQTFQIFGTQVFNAVQTGGDKLIELASLSHTTTAQFQQEWQTDRLGAIQAVLNGFAQLDPLERETAEHNLGITGQQTQAFDILADAVTRPGKSLQDFSNIAQQAFGNSSQLTQVYQAYLDTTNAKQKQLTAEVEKLANSIGQDILPVANEFFKVLGDILNIIEQIPGGTTFLAIAAALAIVAGTTLTFGAALILIVTRLLAAKAGLDAYIASVEGAEAEHIKFTSVMTSADTEIEAASSSMAEALIASNEAIVASELATTQATRAFYEELGLSEAFNAYAVASGNVVRANLEASQSEAALTTETEVTTGALIEQSTAASTLSGVLGAAVPILGALAFGFISFEQDVAKAKTSMDSFAQSVANQQGSTSLADINAQISTLQDKLNNLKLPSPSIGDFFSHFFAPGTDEAVFQKQQDDLKSHIQDLEAEISNATKLSQDFGITIDQAFTLASQNGVQLTGNIADIERRLKEAQNSNTPSTNTASQTTAAATDTATNAFVKYEKELNTANDATNAVANAQVNLATQLEAVAEQAEQTADAQRKVAEAQIAQQTSAITVLQDQIKVQFAAQDQALALADAQSAVAQAEQRQVDNINAVTKAQQALQDLNGPDYETQYQQAINSVSDAQLSLVDANQKAADAQWYLNYLIQEGASPRDISDAQLALADANQKVTDTTTSLSAAQEKVQELPTDHAQQVADATNALANAQLQAQSNTEALTKAQENLTQQEILAANNVGPRTATLALADAKLREQDATYAVITAQENLDKIQNGSAQNALRSAVDSLNNSLYSEAEALTQQQIDLDASNGQTDTASQQAAILAQNLINVGNAVGNMGLVQAGNNILTYLNSPIQTVISSLEQLGVAASQASAAAQLVTQLGISTGAAAGITNDFGTIRSHAGGGLITQNELAVLHAPEVVLPLNDINASMALLQQSGLINSIIARVPASTISAGAFAFTAPGATNNRGGDTFNLTAITTADPSQIVDKWFWGQAIRSRS